MAGLGERASYQQRAMGTLLVATVLLGVLGLPVAVWLDLQILSERVLRMQASETSRIIDDYAWLLRQRRFRARAPVAWPVRISSRLSR